MIVVVVVVVVTIVVVEISRWWWWWVGCGWWWPPGWWLHVCIQRYLASNFVHRHRHFLHSALFCIGMSGAAAWLGPDPADTKANTDANTSDANTSDANTKDDDIGARRFPNRDPDQYRVWKKMMQDCGEWDRWYKKQEEEWVAKQAWYERAFATDASTVADTSAKTGANTSANTSAKTVGDTDTPGASSSR